MFNAGNNPGIKVPGRLSDGRQILQNRLSGAQPGEGKSSAGTIQRHDGAYGRYAEHRKRIGGIKLHTLPGLGSAGCVFGPYWLT